MNTFKQEIVKYLRDMWVYVFILKTRRIKYEPVVVPTRNGPPVYNHSVRIKNTVFILSESNTMSL